MIQIDLISIAAYLMLDLIKHNTLDTDMPSV